MGYLVRMKDETDLDLILLVTVVRAGRPHPTFEAGQT